MIEARLNPTGNAVMLEVSGVLAEPLIVAVTCEPDSGLIKPERLINAMKTLAAMVEAKRERV